MATMNPLDIFKRTPKTNCGACGHPTCLAFGAAVAKTGEDPTRCPHLDLTGLELGAREAGSMEDLARERDLALVAHLKSKVAALDFGALAEPLGAGWNVAEPDVLTFAYLGRAVRLAKSGILMAGAEPEDPRDQILLYNYVSMAGGRAPDNTWVGLESLPNTISKVRTLATYSEAPLARLFADLDSETIRRLGHEIGAIAGPGTSGEVELIVPVLPMLPQYVIFWPAEPADGFAAKVKVLFDHHVLDFLDVESLIFTAERMAERFAELAA